MTRPLRDQLRPQKDGTESTSKNFASRTTRLVTVSLFHTPEERDGMLKSGMDAGLNQSYAALDGVLASL